MASFSRAEFVTIATFGLFKPESAEEVTIRQVYPAIGPQSGGNEVVITLKEACTGGVTAVAFGGVSADFSYSNTTIRATAPAAASLGAKSITVTACSGDVDTITYTYIADTAVTPILLQAETKMRELIAAMDTANGYNFAWGSVNTEDKAKMTFPAAYVHVEPEEENLDIQEGIHTQAYFNRVRMRVSAWYRMPRSSNPSFDIDAYLIKMCDDLKKLFGIYNTLDGVVAHIQYVRSERVDEDSSDSQIPKRLDAFFDIDYYQDRYVPTITA